MTQPASRAARVWRSVRWYSRAVLGADAYERYVEHAERTHPGCEVLSRKQFWRQRQDEQRVDPGSRCC